MIKTEKLFAICGLAVCLILPLAACAKPVVQENSISVQEMTENNIDGSLADPHFSRLGDDEAAVFASIAEMYPELDPVALLGRQMVAGINYMFLAFDREAKEYKTIVAYENFNGSVTVTDTAKFSVDELSGEPNLNGDIPGGWNVNNEYSIIVLPEMLNKPFGSLSEDDESIIYDAIAYLGYNEMAEVLAHVSEHEEGEVRNGLAVVSMNADGNIENIRYLNLTDYIS